MVEEEAARAAEVVVAAVERAAVEPADGPEPAAAVLEAPPASASARGDENEPVA